jgi:putative addiction module component (TIGR02574 family)
MNLEELEAEVLKLNPHARAQLAEKLLQSLDVLSEVENERLWADEALRRDEELETGATTPRAAEDVFREARARLT